MIIKCTQCGLMSGEKDEDHSKINVGEYHCTECQYSWQEVADIEDWREDR
jgi:hypothetical protein